MNAIVVTRVPLPAQMVHQDAVRILAAENVFTVAKPLVIYKEKTVDSGCDNGHTFTPRVKSWCYCFFVVFLISIKNVTIVPVYLGRDYIRKHCDIYVKAGISLLF